METQNRNLERASLEPPGTIANWILVLTGSNHGPLPNLGDFMVAQSLGGMTQ